MIECDNIYICFSFVCRIFRPFSFQCSEKSTELIEFSIIRFPPYSLSQWRGAQAQNCFDLLRLETFIWCGKLNSDHGFRLYQNIYTLCILPSDVCLNRFKQIDLIMWIFLYASSLLWYEERKISLIEMENLQQINTSNIMTNAITFTRNTCESIIQSNFIVPTVWVCPSNRASWIPQCLW